MNAPRIRVLAVIGALGVGGAERQLLGLFTRLDRARFDLAVFVLKPGAVLERVAVAAGVEVFHAAGDPCGPGGLVRSAAALWRTLRRWRPGVVHFLLPEAYLVGLPVALLATRARRVMGRRSLNDYQRKYLGVALLERVWHRAVHAVVGNSCAVTSQLRDEGVPPARLALIYNGVACNDYQRIERAQARATLDLAADACVIVTVANLIAYKGHADLLQALATVAERLPANWRLVCCGRDDGIGAELAALAERLDIARHVRWCGSVDEVGTILAAADLAVLASHEEGFSNAVLEAMAAGIAVVATDVGGNREALGGVAGRIVAARSPATLGTAIADLAADADLRARHGAAGRQRARECFGWPTCVERYTQLYQWLADGAPPPLPESVRAPLSSTGA